VDAQTQKTGDTLQTVDRHILITGKTPKTVDIDYITTGDTLLTVDTHTLLTGETPNTVDVD
jgi:hypothetical protein